MTLDDFRQSLPAAEPPAGLSHALAGLWWDGKADWKLAHESAHCDEGTLSGGTGIDEQMMIRTWTERAPHHQ